METIVRLGRLGRQGGLGGRGLGLGLLGLGFGLLLFFGLEGDSGERANQRDATGSPTTTAL